MTTLGEQVMRFAQFPVIALDALLGEGGAVVVAPHPDDETLGCGGLIAACAAVGRPATVILLTDGAASHPGSREWPPERLAALRQAELHAAMVELGGAGLVALGLPDGAVRPDDAQALAAISRIIGETGASAVFSPWSEDSHPDHQACAAIVAAALRNSRHVSHYAYPIWALQRPSDDPIEAVVEGYRLAVAAHLPHKRRALAQHRSQLGEIVQDVSGFALSPAMVARFMTPYETFIAL